MTDTTTPVAPAIPVSSNIASGIALLESAIQFFETVESGKYASVMRVLDVALMLAKML